MMLKMSLQPSVSVISIAEEAQINNLNTPFRDLIILYSFHLANVILQI